MTKRKDVSFIFVAIFGILFASCVTTTTVDSSYRDANVAVSDHAFLYIGSRISILSIDGRTRGYGGEDLLYLVPSGERTIRIITQMERWRIGPSSNPKNWENITVERKPIPGSFAYEFTFDFKAGRNYFLYTTEGRSFTLVDETDPSYAWDDTTGAESRIDKANAFLVSNGITP